MQNEIKDILWLPLFKVLDLSIAQNKKLVAVSKIFEKQKIRIIKIYLFYNFSWAIFVFESFQFFL